MAKAGERKRAKLEGRERYWTGVPCRLGHVSERRTSNCGCIECEGLQHEKHRDRIAAYQARYRADNVEKRQAYKEEYRKRVRADPVRSAALRTYHRNWKRKQKLAKQES